MIKCAIVPVAGYGTRLLPATKSQPKEMLPVARKPIVQYVVEELVANSVEEILFVTGRDNQGEIVKTGFAYSTHPDQLNLVTDPNDAAIAQGGTFNLTRVAYWGPYTGKVNDSVSKALERIYSGDQTVDEAFAQSQDEIQAALDGK